MNQGEGTNNGGSNQQSTTTTTSSTLSTRPVSAQRIVLNVATAATPDGQDGANTSSASTTTNSQLQKLVTFSTSNGQSLKLPQIVFKQVTAAAAAAAAANHPTLIHTSGSSSTTSGAISSANVLTISSLNSSTTTSTSGTFTISGNNVNNVIVPANTATTSSVVSANDNVMANVVTISNNGHFSNGTFLSRVPISDDGMGHCIRCGAVGVKDTFYGKGKQYCSGLCSRGGASTTTTTTLQQNQAPLYKIVTVPFTKIQNSLCNSGDSLTNQLVTVAMPVPISSPAANSKPSTSVAASKEQPITAAITSKQLNNGRVIFRTQQGKSLINNRLAAQLVSAASSSGATLATPLLLSPSAGGGSGKTTVPAGATVAQLVQIDPSTGQNKQNFKVNLNKITHALTAQQQQQQQQQQQIQLTTGQNLKVCTTSSVPLGAKVITPRRTKRSSSSSDSTPNTGGKAKKHKTSNTTSDSQVSAAKTTAQFIQVGNKTSSSSSTTTTTGINPAIIQLSSPIAQANHHHQLIRTSTLTTSPSATAATSVGLPTRTSQNNNILISQLMRKSQPTAAVATAANLQSYQTALANSNAVLVQINNSATGAGSGTSGAQTKLASVSLQATPAQLQQLFQQQHKLSTQQLLTANSVRSLLGPGVKVNNETNTHGNSIDALVSGNAAVKSPLKLPGLATPTPAPILEPKLTILEQIKLLDEAVHSSNRTTPTQINGTKDQSAYPPGWAFILEKHGHERCAPVSTFANTPLATVLPHLINRDSIYFEIRHTSNGEGSGGTTTPTTPTGTPLTNHKSKSTKRNCELATDPLKGDGVHFWFVKIIAAFGYYLKVRYLGAESNSKDFLINIRHRNLYPIGFAHSNGFKYKPPAELIDLASESSCFGQMAKYLPTFKKVTFDLHAKFTEEFHCKIPIGLRVEVVDKNRLSTYRLATVDQVIGQRIHVYYDGATPDDNGFWTYLNSGYIRPVGWAQIVGHELFASTSYAKQSLNKMIQIIRHQLKFNNKRCDYVRLGLLTQFERYNSKTRFKEGMKLEVVDPYNQSSICVATVKKILRFNFLMISIDNLLDEPHCSRWFCFHSSSPYLLPAGFCATFDIPLKTPIGYNHEFDWVEYSLYTDSTLAPVDFFSCNDFEHSFTEGMLLEAVDLIEPNLVCVAVVKRIVGRLLLLHFVGWDDNFDQWCDCYSSNIFPVGYCDLINYPLEGPPVNGKGSDKNRRRTPAKKKRKANTPVKGKTNQVISSSVDKYNLFVDTTMINGGLSGDHPESDSTNQLDLFVKNFLTDNEIINEGVFLEFNPVGGKVSLNHIDLGDGRKFGFEINYEPVLIFDGDDQLVAEYTYDEELQRQRLASVYCDESDVSRLAESLPDRIQIKHSAVIPIPLGISCTDIRTIREWTPFQVAKFLCENNFDQISDLIIVNKIDGTRLLTLNKTLALKVAINLPEAMKLLNFVDRLKRRLFASVPLVR